MPELTIHERVDALEQSELKQNERLDLIESNHTTMEKTLSLHQSVIQEILDKQKEMNVKQDTLGQTLETVNTKVTEFSTKQDIALTELKDSNNFLREFARSNTESTVALLGSKELTKREQSMTRRLVGAEAFKWLVALCASPVIIALINWLIAK
ncbi:MAG: hypothetical protein IKG65_15000 [Exiguobacterium sp.]|nr:hypothetical protein [Exiguobacterium sp.]MBR3063683.1 hypothetical protein [Exiguobacterium sp.]MBR3218162.1 hypothetical protein [Exiguobacterium sp.]